VPLGKDDFATVVSDVISREDFQNALSIDRGIVMRARSRYVDVDGAVYETGICQSRLKSGAIEYCEEKEDNYFKEISRPPN
jgi:hypothetical protein